MTKPTIMRTSLWDLKQTLVNNYKLNSLMQFFTFNVIKFSQKQALPYHHDEFGGYLFVDDLSFINQGDKFDRVGYLKKTKEQSDKTFQPDIFLTKATIFY